MKISVIVPCFNEEDNIDFVVDEIINVLRGVKADFDVNIIDDGSTDSTFEKAESIAKKQSCVKVFRHDNNRGKDAALWTGFSKTNGDVLVTLDGDGQNDFHDVVKLLPLLNQYDAVFGQRIKRRDPLKKRIASAIAYRMRAWILDDKVKDTGCAFKVIKRKTLQHLLPVDGVHRFISFLFHEAGVPFIEVPVNHRPRTGGVSKFSLMRLYFIAPIADFFFMRWFKTRVCKIYKSRVVQD